MAKREVSAEALSDNCELVRVRLRTLVRGFSDVGRENEISEQVLMDVDLDGHRYLLIRMPAAERKVASLSPREIEIVRLIAAGRPNKVIAAVLEISSWTVCTHIRRVFAKLGVSSRAAMVARLAEFGGVLDGFPLSSPQRAQLGGDNGRGEALRPSDGHSLVPIYRAEPSPFMTRPNGLADRPRVKRALGGGVAGD